MLARGVFIGESTTMAELIDLVGKKFGKLTVISFNKKEKGHYYWNCICDCGKECVKDGDRLRRLETKSCGCYRADRVTTHGKHNSRIYIIWRGMKTRCSCHNIKAYKWYGGRGINYISEWENFEPFYQWAMNNGYKDDLTLDRIDVNGNYEPSNCRWVTMKEQARNTSKNFLIEYGGITHCLAEWAEILKMKSSTLYGRLHSGRNIEEAFETPINERKKDKKNEK